MRKKITVKIESEGRDKGKVFQIEEMSALEGEWWGTRAAAAIRDANPEIGQIIGTGMQAVAIAGMRGLIQIPAGEFFGLGNDLLQAVTRIRDEAHPGTASTLIEGDIEEVETRLRLKQASLEMHLGFSIAELMSKLTSVSAPRTSPEDLSPTQTSPTS